MLKIESDFEYNGYRCVTTFNSMGFRCGYVGIQKYRVSQLGKYWFDNSLSVHGGVTFSGEDHPVEDPNLYFIGFDCGHYGDGYDFDEVLRLWGDDDSIRESIYILADEKFHQFPARTLDYVQNECRQMVDQIVEYFEEREHT